MKSTDTSITLARDIYTSQDGRPMLQDLVLRFNLSVEDFSIVEREILPTLKNCDLADAFLACLTFGIHKAWEEIHGEPFVLDMDRKRPKA